MYGAEGRQRGAPEAEPYTAAVTHRPIDDEIARDAARLLTDSIFGGGRVTSAADAIRAAAARRRAEPSTVPLALVREHVRGLAMETLGVAGYSAHVADILERAEELMTLLSHSGADRGLEPRTALVGRAARGQVDADPTCRIRVETTRTDAELADLIVAAGYEEPRFETVDSRFGRLSAIVVDDDGVTHRVMRCPPSMRIPFDRDLRSGQPIPSLDLEGLRRAIDALRACNAE